MTECSIENVGVDPHWAQWIDFETETEPILAPVATQTGSTKQNETTGDENKRINASRPSLTEVPIRKASGSPRNEATAKPQDPRNKRQVFEMLRKHTNALLPRTEALLMAIIDSKGAGNGTSKEERHPSEPTPETTSNARRNSRAKSLGSILGKFRWR